MSHCYSIVALLCISTLVVLAQGIEATITTKAVLPRATKIEFQSLPSASACDECQFVLGFTEVTELPTAVTINPSGIVTTGAQSFLYIVFTAYNVSSAFLLSNGVCTTFQGSPINFSPPFAVQVPSTANVLAFLPNAESSAVNFLGLPTCTLSTIENITQITVTTYGSSIKAIPISPLAPDSTATNIITIFRTSIQNVTAVVASPSSTLSTSSPPPLQNSTILNTAAKVGLSVALPILFITCITVGGAVWWSRRKRQHTATELPNHRRQEMEGKDRSYELPGQEGRHELRTVERSQEMLGNSNRAQEMMAVVPE